MNWVVINSPVIARVAYDEQEQELTVHYTTGKYYVFYPVPLEKYEGLKAAEHPGSYLTEEIRNHSRYERVLL